MLCTLTPSAYRHRSLCSTFLSSMVTSTRSMSDLAHTVSCDMLPHSTAARTERSVLTCSINRSRAALNFCGADSDVIAVRRETHDRTRRDGNGQAGWRRERSGLREIQRDGVDLDAL